MEGSTALLGRTAITLPVPFFDARECVELARRAEREWGYRAVWLAETNGPDSFGLAGAVAWATQQVTIGTAIVPVYNRTPAVLAMSAGTLAQLSGDRFVLGLGSSSHAIVGDWNGVPFERPLAARQAMRLSLGHHLQAILRPAQESVGGQQVAGVGCGENVHLRERDQRRLRGPAAYLWDAAPVQELQRLGDGLDVASLETAVKYVGYLKRQQSEVDRLRRDERRRIPDGFRFEGIAGLSREVVQRLSQVRPDTLGHASRIPGVTPAAVAILAAHVARQSASRPL